MLLLVLVEPAGPRNVGSVARLCANFGIGQLRFVAPRCDPLGAEARQMAVHGAAHLEQAATYPTLAAALADCSRVVAATGRLQGPPLPLQSPQEALKWLLGAGVCGNNPSLQPAEGAAALVFGREDRGLSNAELLQAGCLLHIPTSAVYPSLNLSHAVAVVLHQLWLLRQGQGELLEVAVPITEALEANLDKSLAQRGAIEAALADAEALLLEVGFLLPHTVQARMAKLRALLQRAQLTHNDLALLRGMVCQLRWACRRGVATGQGS
ncbi:MAG: RNA methyltransferase [Cyanobium sp.]